MMLQDESWLQALKETEPGIARKILAFLKRWLGNLRAAFRGVEAQSAEAKAILEHMDELQALWNRGLASAVDTYRRTEKNTAEDGGAVQYSFKGYDAATGRGIYESNFPKGTPKRAKGEKILYYIQNVWSKKPIRLVVKKPGEKERVIYAQFDPTYHGESGEISDASKLMGGNKHGNATEKRVTLDLADDYYQIATESTYNGSLDEKGKTTVTHDGVIEWHYFINDIFFQEYGSVEMQPYRVTINVKEKADGQFVYSFNAEVPEEGKQKTKGQAPDGLIHAAVTPGIKAESNAQPSNDSIPTSEGKSKTQNSARETDGGLREVEQSFGITSVNDYVGVQKAVISTLEKENFFSSGKNIVTNRDSGMIVEITKDGIRETLGPGKRFAALPRVLKDLKLATLRDLPEIIASATVDTDSANNIHTPNSKVKYAYLNGETTINGIPYVVTVTVRRSQQKNKFWVHEVRTEKKEQGLSSSGGVSQQQEYNKALVPADTVPQEGDGVKTQHSARDTTAITDREILAHTLDSAAQTQMERTLLARYRAHAEELRKLEGQITYNRNMLKAVENGNAKATQTEITRIRNRVNGYARLADREEAMLRSLAKKEALQAVLQRERTYIEQQGGNAVLFSYHQHTFSWISFSILIYYVIIRKNNLAEREVTL